MEQYAEQLNQLPRALLAWYDGCARILPWRDDPTAYHVWVSEIMLQQTRVSAVLPYYERFLAALPDVETLAGAEEDVLLKLWEGLGYYNRVRNLQKAARCIMEQHGGCFPGDYETILTLPGIGEYTAGAIASIAFGEKVPAVDGNVLRVVARITGDGSDVLQAKVKAKFRSWLLSVQPDDRPGDFNQALMELGAVVCLPNGAPRCDGCPARAFCAAHLENTWQRLPVKKKKAPRRVEEKTVFVLKSPAGVALRKRPDAGLLAGLWEFPNVPGALDEAQAVAQVEAWGLRAMNWQQRLEAKHIFTHVEWHMRGYVLEVKSTEEGDFLWADGAKMEECALPSAFARFTQAVKEGFSEKENREL